MIKLEEYAAWVHQIAQAEYFKTLLHAFQVKAEAMGFEFVEGKDPCALTEGEKDDLGAAVLRAKIMDLASRMDSSDQDAYVCKRTEEGEASRWTGFILDALAKREVVLRRSVAVAEQTKDRHMDLA